MDKIFLLFNPHYSTLLTFKLQIKNINIPISFTVVSVESLLAPLNFWKICQKVLYKEEIKNRIINYFQEAGQTWVYMTDGIAWRWNIQQ